MAGPAWNPIANTSEYSSYGGAGNYAYGELSPGERIGAPLASRRRKAIVRLLVAALIAGGGWWAMQDDQAILRERLLAEAAAVYASLNRMLPSPGEPAALAAATPALPPITERTTTTTAFNAPSAPDAQPASSKTATMPNAAAGTAGAPAKTAALSPAAKGADGAAASSLPPPTIDPADPHQKRASAVGLHPDLSRVLLARLSDADYRNAGVAIKTALAETADDGVFVWPRQRKPEFALFKVHFVPGGAPDCRRYVVTVTKDGWLTTALPMEKCGAKPGGPRRE